MKKKMLVLFLAVGMILGGCQNTQEKPQTGKGEETSRDETEDTPEEEKNYDVKLSKNLYDFEFAIMIRFFICRRRWMIGRRLDGLMSVPSRKKCWMVIRFWRGRH